MIYWVYENWRHHRARVHTAECSHCNDGHGKRDSDLSSSGRWHGRFDDRADAFNFMGRIDQDDKAGCHFCNP